MYNTLSKNEKEVLNQANEIIAERLEELNRRSRFCIQPAEIARQYGISAADLHSFLKDKNIIFRKQGCYHLAKKYQGLGLTEYQFSLKTGGDGHPRLKPKLVWTETGRQFLNDFIMRIDNMRIKN